MENDFSQLGNDHIADLIAEQMEMLVAEAVAKGIPRAAVAMGMARAARRIRDKMASESKQVH